MSMVNEGSQLHPIPTPCHLHFVHLKEELEVICWGMMSVVNANSQLHPIPIPCRLHFVHLERRVWKHFHVSEVFACWRMMSSIDEDVPACRHMFSDNNTAPFRLSTTNYFKMTHFFATFYLLQATHRNIKYTMLALCRIAAPPHPPGACLPF